MKTTKKLVSVAILFSFLLGAGFSASAAISPDECTNSIGNSIGLMGCGGGGRE
ncbi:hypothetical protein [Bacillus sp. SM2101]|uniref:hypothetical protein n=1 Tax=Bacillus sp. SM2101 TaxID=2805366 RepID=UPI001BDEA30D|nr:hypothetical protein [Bacillus sp. SM2101]